MKSVHLCLLHRRIVFVKIESEFVGEYYQFMSCYLHKIIIIVWCQFVLTRDVGIKGKGERLPRIDMKILSLLVAIDKLLSYTELNLLRRDFDSTICQSILEEHSALVGEN